MNFCLYFTILKYHDQSLVHKNIAQDHCSKLTREAINILVKSYKASTNYHQLSERVAERVFCFVGRRSFGEGGKPIKLPYQSLVLTRRSLLNLYRDLGYYRLHLAVAVFITVCPLEILI